MFFLLRSACCIGLVVAALPEPDGRMALRPLPAASAALSAAERLCAAAPARCAAVLRQTSHSASSDMFLSLAVRARDRASHDTLTAADREPAWVPTAVVAD